MENSSIEKCSECLVPLPRIGFFCGKCLTQFKCKSCNAILEKDYAGCINCGTPRENRGSNESSTGKPFNTFRLHETPTDRIIEATFSDNVGKELAGLLKETYTLKIGNQQAVNNRKIKDEVDKEKVSTEREIEETFEEAEEILDDNAQGTHPSKQSQTSSPSNLNTYPTLKAIAMKNLPGPETEWIAVYSFYASNFGEELFKREDLIKQYVASNRFNKATTKRDLSTHIKRAVVAGYINPLQENFSMLDLGMEKAKEIISRTSGASPRISKSKVSKNEIESKDEEKTNKIKKTASNAPKNLKRLDIDFFPVGKESLEDYYNRYTCKNDFERNLLFINYLQEVLGVSIITVDHVYTSYDSLELRVSENLPQTLRNTKSDTGWIDKVDKSFVVTIKGKNQIRNWNKPKS